ncbi:MAG: 1-phosphofructokinase family hexose kinase [Chitinophagaceae bacterium]|nr:1-phosphofructokinase family hexose kinase [Chitinophagaceae bacterium]
MPSVLTLTFSPCIDKSTTVPELIPSKKLKCSQPELDPGGGGINVARAIKKLGGMATAVYPAGGYTGKAFNALLAKENIPVIIVESANDTRENIVILEEKTSKQYRFNMPATPLSENEWKECLQAVENSKDVEFIVASGSLPPGVPDDIYARLAIIARTKKAKFVVDTSGEALKQAAKEGVYLLKPNLGELSSLVNSNHYLQENEIEAVAKQVITRGNCEVLVVSMGDKGAMLFTSDLMKKIVPPPVEVKSTVGAGDSMVAGIVYALSTGKSLETALEYGVAAGTAATLHPGTELCSKIETERLLAVIHTGETY